MVRRPSQLAVVAAVAILPVVAEAQFSPGGPDTTGIRGSGRRSGSSSTAMTPAGPVVIPTQTREWRLAGGDPRRFQVLMQQKALLQQQKLLARQQREALKRQKAFEKWGKDQKAKKEKGEPTDPVFDQWMRQIEANRIRARVGPGRPRQAAPAAPDAAAKPVVDEAPEPDAQKAP
jgi:hypothetical protein